ncbi:MULTISPECIES: PcfJ domain-containing protein [Entomomonas]|uniref:PcfJ domain-containing protein n=1 Tax=Entomomonas asaccharolytica TaxID=2785331 RepID=A0A974NHP1_9GAMM|nr:MULTISPECIES: PcfJ domain-containing protein [Entomomonas]QQP86833.1 PcfJ domain-containing protein [Entomomonas asaccharolytica]UYZ83549.1 PcfJ domain-containing protein [Entomomonas sp. E2T0]
MTIEIEKLSTKYSASQIEHALLWKERFKKCADNPDKFEKNFLKDYLDITNRHYFWFYQISDTEVILRLFDYFLYYDGQFIRGVANTYRKASPKKLTKRYITQCKEMVIEQGCYYDPLIPSTSFTDKFRENIASYTKYIYYTLLVKKYFKVVDKHYHNAYNIDKEIWNQFHTNTTRFIRGKNYYFLRLAAFKLKLFNQALNPNILKLIRSVRCPTYRLYNWVAEGNSSYREQLIRAQPVLVPMLVLHDVTDIHPLKELLLYLQTNNYPWKLLNNIKKPDLIEKDYIDYKLPYKIKGEPQYLFNLFGVVADRQLPLNEVLSFFFRTPSIKEISYIGKMRVYDLGGAISYTHYNIYDWLFDGTKLGNIKPKNKKEWQAWRKLYWKYEEFITKRPDLISFFKGVKNPLNEGMFDEYKRTKEDYMEMIRNLSTTRLGGDNLFYELRDKLESHLSYIQLKNILIKYHKVLPKLQAKLTQELTGLNQGNSWQPMLNQNNLIAPNKVVITELLTPEALEKEGRSMKHCVASYFSSCFEGYCRIISFRKEGKSLATAEFNIQTVQQGDSYIDEIQCRQFRGFGNKETPKEADEAYRWFSKYYLSTSSSIINLDWPDESYKIDGLRYFRNKLSDELRHWLKGIIL